MSGGRDGGLIVTLALDAKTRDPEIVIVIAAADGEHVGSIEMQPKMALAVADDLIRSAYGVLGMSAAIDAAGGERLTTKEAAAVAVKWQGAFSARSGMRVTVHSEGDGDA